MSEYVKIKDEIFFKLKCLGFTLASRLEYPNRFENETGRISIYVYEINRTYDEFTYAMHNHKIPDIHSYMEKAIETNKANKKFLAITSGFEADETALANASSVDDLINAFEYTKKYDFYVAGPFFNDDHLKSIGKIEKILTKHNKTMFRPRYDAGQIDLSKATEYECFQVFRNDLIGIESCRAILADTTYKDSGTSVEIGYAYGLSHTDVWILNDTKTSGKKVNLMLAQAAVNSFSSYSELDKFLTALEKDEKTNHVSKFDLE